MMVKSNADRFDWLRLARTENVGPITFQSLLRRYGSAGKALDALPELSRLGGRSREIRPCAIDRIEAEMVAAEQFGAQFVFPGEAAYPDLLRHSHGAPAVLCVAGDLSVASRPMVAMVGARNASAAGLSFTRVLARSLAERGHVVVSGLARGIDTAAHQASVAYGTLAVVAGGVDHIYPPENAELHHQIARTGLVVSEMPMGTVPRAEHFPRRNRIISGMAQATIVVEAALKSGSLITARFANEQGREVFAVPGSPLDPRSAGSNRLIRDGATIITSVEDVFEALNALPPVQSEMFLEDDPAVIVDVSDDDRERVLSYLSPTAVHLDDLLRECGLVAEQVSGILLELELAGRVNRSAGGRVALNVG